MEKTKKQMVMDVVESLGYRPQMDDEGDIYLRFEMKNIYILTGEEDDRYVMVLLPQSVDVEQGQEGMAFAICNRITREYKVLKAYVDRSLRSVSACCELFYTDEESLTQNIAHSFKLIGIARSTYKSIMRECTEE